MTAGRGDVLADVARLIEVPVIELVGLGLLHRLDDVVVLDLADAQERGEQRDGDATQVPSRAAAAITRAGAFQPAASVRGLRRIDVHACDRERSLPARYQEEAKAAPDRQLRPSQRGTRALYRIHASRWVWASHGSSPSTTRR